MTKLSLRPTLDEFLQPVCFGRRAFFMGGDKTMIAILIIAASCFYASMIALTATICFEAFTISCDDDRAIASIVAGIFWPVGLFLVLGWKIGQKINALLKK